MIKITGMTIGGREAVQSFTRQSFEDMALVPRRATVDLTDDQLAELKSAPEGAQVVVTIEVVNAGTGTSTGSVGATTAADKGANADGDDDGSKS